MNEYEKKDYVTLHINRKTLSIMVVVLLYSGSVFGAYRVGFKSGVKNVLQTLAKIMAQQENGADEPEHAPAFEPGVGSTK